MAFLNELMNILEAENAAKFSRMCEKQQPNMTNYLNGNLQPGDVVLKDCVLNATVCRIFDYPPSEGTPFGNKAAKLRNRVLSRLFRKDIRACRELESIPDKRTDFPTSAGVYILYDSAGNVLYVGKATNFRDEVPQTLNRRVPVKMRFGPDMTPVRPPFKDLATYLSLYRIDNKVLRHNIEALLIRVFINHTHNTRIGKFKTG